MILPACLTLAQPAAAQTTAGLNFAGQVGIIDMPSGEQLPDGFLTINRSQFGPISRTGLRFQITPRLSGTFRYIGVRDWNAKIPGCQDNDPATPCLGADLFSTYYDRQFDIAYQVLTEGRFLPSVTIGLQDFVGTGLSSGEYIAATKNFADGRLKVTAGIGFGRLGGNGSLGQPLGARPAISFGNGGNANYKQWFRGNAAPFGGIEYQVTDKFTVKAEYSSDLYTNESAERGTFQRKSSLNFGVEYRPNDAVHLGAYYMYGSQIGFNVTFFLNPGQRGIGGIAGTAPIPVQVRPARASHPDAWQTGWTDQADIHEVLLASLNNNLTDTGIAVESLGFTATRVQVRVRNSTYDAAAQAVGRVSRALARIMPASVELFEIVLVDHGIPTSKVVLRRTDIENLEFAPDAGHALRIRTDIVDAGEELPGAARNPALYPQFKWSILPFGRTMMFDPDNPFQVGVGLRFAAQYELQPGIIFSATATQLLFGNIKGEKCDNCAMQHVRSDGSYYDTHANPGLETLTAAWYAKVAPNVFSRVTIGYLERMFAGVSAEVLWRPVNKPWAIGAEAAYVAQRDTDGGLGFGEYNYNVATGHVSGYYDFGKGYQGQIDIGRYLAGDVGVTLTLSREFANGWKIGAFATKTNVSAATFGEGSFDKGIMLTIPFNWLSGAPSRSVRPLIIRPIGRDGGARLDVTDRLYDVLHSYDQTRMDAQWGRVWK